MAASPRHKYTPVSAFTPETIPIAAKTNRTQKAASDPLIASSHSTFDPDPGYLTGRAQRPFYILIFEPLIGII